MPKDGARLRNSHGETVDSTQPVPVATEEGLLTTEKSQTLTYNGKAAAGAVTILGLSYKKIFGIDNGRIASHWNLEKNKVYDAFVDGNPKKGLEWLTSVVETNGSAAFSVFDPNRNLENLFEGQTTTVKRFVAKLTDRGGHVIYGWIFGVSVSSNLYTFNVVNHRLTETQNWVGDLTAFVHTTLDRVEIFRYDSSLAFGTGTTLTEEVACPREFSKTRRAQYKYAIENLTNGQFFVDYLRAELVGKKADTTASETVTYNILAAGASSGGATEAKQDSQITELQAIKTAVQIMDDWDNTASDGASVSGDVAHDGPDAGEPVKFGGKAVTAPVAVSAANDRVNAQFDLWGRQTVQGALREMKSWQITTITSSVSETTIVTADVTYKLDIYAILVINTSATATEISVKDSTAGTTRFWISVPANDMRGYTVSEDSGGVQAAVNNNWTATCADSVASIIITPFFVKNL